VKHSKNFQISEISFQNYLTLSQYLVLAATTDCDEILGYIIVQKSFDVIDVIYICVHTCYYRRGIATKLLQCSTWNIDDKNALDTTPTWNAQRNIEIFLEVAVNNTEAVALYNKCGFSILTVRKAYAQSKNFYLMVKKL
jgi:ribosomal protein S18 acetylase RimI-like enzyme